MAFTNTNNSVSDRSSIDFCSSTHVKICSLLTLGPCSCSTTKETTQPTDHSSTKKRKLASKETDNKKKKKGCYEENKGWGFSTDLMLYDDPWKIKKVLKESDVGVGNMCRLLLDEELVEDLVIPVLGVDNNYDIGIEVSIWDLDTNSMHSLVFKRCPFSGSFVFMEGWVHDFVVRRDLKRGDEIGLHWDPYKKHFNFCVFQIYDKVQKNS
ncbi:B3 domain-containing protein At2g33720-like [Cicer arietinum]|uniref:B3 domain-containing protein At1g78640 n=1 Tax=Cicer arietinum TaxID=3827 RepID=A0A1S2Y1B8_CICAR|nr:putative B3 domain-containing protein At1g78640 [Cicer arietinum]